MTRRDTKLSLTESRHHGIYIIDMGLWDILHIYAQQYAMPKYEALFVFLYVQALYNVFTLHIIYQAKK